MEYIYNDDLRNELSELSKETIKDLQEERDRKAYEILSEIKDNRSKIEKLMEKREEILKDLPEEKVREVKAIYDEIIEYMSIQKDLKIKLFGINNYYGSRVNKYIDILESYGISSKVYKDRVTAFSDANICVCESCKIKFNAGENSFDECPYCGSKNITCQICESAE